MANKKRTVRVRIAVAITKEGHWNAVGWDTGSDVDRMSAAIDGLDADEEARHWIEADVEVPEESMIEGAVSSAAVETP